MHVTLKLTLQNGTRNPIKGLLFSRHHSENSQILFKEGSNDALPFHFDCTIIVLFLFLWLANPNICYKFFKLAVWIFTNSYSVVFWKIHVKFIIDTGFQTFHTLTYWSVPWFQFIIGKNNSQIPYCHNSHYSILKGELLNWT